MEHRGRAGVGAAGPRVPPGHPAVTAGQVLAGPRTTWRTAAVDVPLVALAVADLVAKAVLGWNAGTLLGAFAVAALLLRRRWPLPAALLGLSSLVTPALQVAPVVLLVTLAARSRRAAVAVAVAAAACVVTTATFWYSGPSALLVNYQSAVYLVGLVGGATALGHVVRLEDLQRARVRELRESRAREHELVERAARADEREALAREMHDVVSHQVSLIAVQAGALRATGTDPQGSAERIRTLAVRANDELRQLLGVLRDPAPDTTVPLGLSDLAELRRATGLEGAVRLPGPAEVALVPGGVQRGAYRIVQEALTNVCRHARGAHVDLDVVVDEPDVVRVVVRNTAPPPGAAAVGLSGGSGLVGAAERAHLLGGSFEAGPTADGGFRVRAVLPLDDGSGIDRREGAR